MLEGANMQFILRNLLIFVVIVIVIFIVFKIHWVLGVGVIAGILLYGFYMNRSTVWVLKANAAYGRGELEKALVLHEKAYASKFRKQQHAISYAFMLMKAGKPEAAEQVLQEAIRSVKSEDIKMQAKYNLATAHWLLNKREKALNLLEEVYRDYKTVTVVGNLGYFKLLNDPESALTFNEEAYEYDDSDLTIVDNLAQNYFLLGRFEEAAKLYDKVMEKNPKHAESYYYYARTLEELGQGEEASAQAILAIERPLAMVTNITKEEMEQLKVRLT